MESLQKLCGSKGSAPSTPWPVISGEGVRQWFVPRDGNCLFSSLWLAFALLRDPNQKVSVDERGTQGAEFRRQFLDKVEQIHKEKKRGRGWT